MADVNTQVMEEFFSEEIELIKKEMAEADSLYGELKDHFDDVKKSKTPGALNFISKQTTNLISAKSNKISLLKDLVSTKKIIIDSAIKTQSEGGDNKDNEMLSKLHRMLLENKKEDYIENLMTPNEPVYDDDYYDNLLESKIAELDEETNEDDNDTKETPKTTGNIENLKYVVDEEKNIYAVDENYNIIDDAPIPNYIIEYREDDNGELRAYNQYEEELEVISIED